MMGQTEIYKSKAYSQDMGHLCILKLQLYNTSMSVKMNKDFDHFFLPPNTQPLSLTWPLSKISKTKTTVGWHGDSLPELKQNRELEMSQ